ncbi:sensor histidine kinase [Ornithinimicrobium cerasi]|uniref:histidine kinase n=1 Tax=Ornithinimicrobium cerasi TaxID=2248773 RepID=A0A285VD23_9MICO|nr:ATP-binding protein [Ornithinimicrobium cerasi]SOC51999.1 Signal transduction histidine kinase [Ornithinimicrobium cerasi]
MTDATPTARHTAWLTLTAWAVGFGAAAWILFGPYLQFAYRSTSARLITETVILCVALLGSFLAHGRFVRSHRMQDLLLAQALIVFALATSPVGTVLGMLVDGRPGGADVWLSVGLQLIGAVLLLAAAIAGQSHRLHLVSRAGARWRTPLVPLLVLVLVLSVLVLIGERVHLAVDPAYRTARTRPELLTAHPFLILTQLTAAFCFLSASTIWTVQARVRDDPLVRWLGPACALGGFARVLYALAPSLYTDWFYVADVLRLGLYLLLLVGSAQEVSHYWTARTRSAVLEDRRRLAGELHDGVVQELTYIRGEAHRVDGDPELQERIVGATDRALDEARAAIHALTRVDGVPLSTMLERTGRELARRHGIEVAVAADATVDADTHEMHTLLRIVREAVTNAARHGRAGTVHVELALADGARVLRVRDDGVGFDPEEAARHATGYGLVSMAERARSLPGTLDVDSAVGAGSEVRVTW